MWFEHVIWTCDLNMWFEHLIWTRNLNMWFERVIWTCDLNTWFEHVIWTRDLNMWFEYVIWTCDSLITTFITLKNNPSYLPCSFYRYVFSLPIQITPVNDAPILQLPKDDVLVLVSNTQIKLSSSLLSATDPDDPATSLEYSVEYPQDADTGYFEISDTVGRKARIMSFTQVDINEGRVDYIHRGLLNQQIQMQVT